MAGAGSMIRATIPTAPVVISMELAPAVPVGTATANPDATEPNRTMWIAMRVAGQSVGAGVVAATMPAIAPGDDGRFAVP